MPTQTDVQQLIQGLTPSGVNNGNPNTAYNQPRQSTPPPIMGADGQWYLNSINPAANQAPQQLGWNAWQAPANSLQRTQVQWPVMQPAPTPAPGGGTPAPTTPVPTTPTPTPTTPVPNVPAPGGPYSSGDPSGYWAEGGQNAGCVAIDQEIYGFISPEGVEVGDIMPTVNPHTFEMGSHEVSYSENKLQPCVTITTESGAALKCSVSAPLLLANGQPELAQNLKVGDAIAVQIDGMFDHSIIASIEDAGDGLVRHITCGNQYFLAGNGNGKYILHHNMKMIEGEAVNLIGLAEQRDRQFGWGGGSGGFGAESMGNHSMFGSTGYRNDNMSSGQYTTGGNGWFENSPQGQAYANSQQPLGQGIIDAFGQTDNPLEMYNKVSESLGNSAAPISGNALGNLTGGNVSSWNPNMNSSIPTMPTVQAVGQAPTQGGMYDYKNSAPEANDTGGFLDKAVNWFDNTVLNNFYDENSNSWNKGNIAWGVLSALTGMPLDNQAQRTSLNNLFTDGGVGSDYARTQTQQAYDRSNTSQREAMVTNLAEKYEKTPMEVLQIIGRVQ